MLTFPFYLLAEWVCFIAAVLLVSNLNNYLHTIRYYLCFVVIVESICYYLAWIERVNNQWLYNIFILVEFSYGIWLYYNFISFKYFKPIIIFFCILFFSTYIFELVSYGGISTFFNRADTIESVIIIGLCMLYYYTLFQQEEYINLSEDPIFWIVSGSFIFYTTSIGLDTFFKKLVEVRINHSISLRYIIMNLLNIILYSCWIKSFICMRIKQKSIRPL
ncbi:MAG: hypothetical protein JWR12_1691 [Mucilaginibacter sp.]|nr:hypothetical protein [Mucilaginibacter sp.]